MNEAQLRALLRKLENRTDEPSVKLAIRIRRRITEEQLGRDFHDRGGHAITATMPMQPVRLGSNRHGTI